MKLKHFLLIILSLSIISAIGQPLCEEQPELLESANYYEWNTLSQSWVLKTIQEYTYNSVGKVETIVGFDAETGEYLSKRDYFYDSNLKLVETISYKWVSVSWQNVQNVLYTSEQDSSIRYETNYNWVNNDWKLQSRTINYYENGNRIGYTAQLVNKTTQDFYDYANYYISYTHFGKIDKWWGEKISDGSILFERHYFYGFDHNLTERHIFSPINGELILTTKNFYYHDSYGYNNEIVNQSIKDEEWVNSGKYIYYRKIDSSKKVTVCHKGKTICVAKSAIPAFLNQGSTLGQCPVNKIKTSGFDKFTQNSSEETFTLSVYPNPAKDSFILSGLSNVESIEIYNSIGVLVRSIRIPLGNELIVEREGLQSGNYFLRIKNEIETTSIKVVFN